MELSNEAIVLFYLLRDRQSVDRFQDGDVIRLDMISRQGVEHFRLSCTRSGDRWRYNASTGLVNSHGMMEILDEYVKIPITITSELREQINYYAKFMEL